MKSSKKLKNLKNLKNLLKIYQKSNKKVSKKFVIEFLSI